MLEELSAGLEGLCCSPRPSGQLGEAGCRRGVKGADYYVEGTGDGQEGGLDW